VRGDNGRYRHPSETDLSAIRKAKWLMETRGAMARIEKADQQTKAAEREARRIRDNRLIDVCEQASRGVKLTKADLERALTGSVDRGFATTGAGEDKAYRWQRGAMNRGSK